eukprot:9765847-Alexandrium_andersonii.AAC.1
MRRLGSALIHLAPQIPARTAASKLRRSFRLRGRQTLAQARAVAAATKTISRFCDPGMGSLAATRARRLHS